MMLDASSDVFKAAVEPLRDKKSLSEVVASRRFMRARIGDYLRHIEAY